MLVFWIGFLPQGNCTHELLIGANVGAYTGCANCDICGKVHTGWLITPRIRSLTSHSPMSCCIITLHLRAVFHTSGLGSVFLCIAGSPDLQGLVLFLVRL
jgi:hypothetical protein